MNNTYNEKTHTSIKQLFNKFSPKAPGFTYIASFDSGVTYKGAVGLASIEGNIPINTKIIFNIASVSKQFTAFSILLLEQEGKLNLDDSIVKFVPSIGAYAEPVTLRHLIHHTGGLVDYMELAEAANIKYTDTLTVEESLEHLKSHQIARFPVGTKFEYSNTGYFLLSQVIEKVSGKSLCLFKKERIFDPLNMRATTIVDYYPTTIPIASGYLKNEQGIYEIYESPWEHTGDGAVHTTVEDLVRWGENLTTGTIGGKDLVKRMSEIGPKISPTGETIINNEDYAFGLRVAEGFNCRYLEHSGGWAGFNSHFMRFPEERLSVAVLSNYDEFDSKKYANEISEIVLEKVQNKRA
ncbi:class A beta-lactamase-related serine hydrolase (plasmid) [Bacillus mycoides]|uniref:serine hydrolase domain-containing protein n=1 Tax=Bacillus mycoides TaxID=1405 RepID=UPI001C00E718|nr:serine hydrolase domain-containing protein [Bacillus mycoides]QWG53943.1 class A beta-lactamase-related serine hydrolase [Bacillus mycoides]QWG59548.1 class A beta-lactamase-related serine hydrolase [Bacillus mycoides]QWG76117.1 class A beta-lactamase-related serine hydrolase [Bacillus mycoides]QWH26408.1 class A beta-lactamase-related serine hydrolase [Bacillus mycoides]QWH37750.1 class A beta-lactamase-related serine hydrolase [Bacillus mycoides]